MNDHVINPLISINYFAAHHILYMAWKNSVPLRLCVETAFVEGLEKLYTNLLGFKIDDGHVPLSYRNWLLRHFRQKSRGRSPLLGL